MEVIKQTETELALIRPEQSQKTTAALRRVFIYSVIALGVSLLLYFVPADEYPSWIGYPIALIRLSSGVLVLFLGGFLLQDSEADPVETCVLDKRSGRATIVTSVAWQLWSPQAKTYPLQDIAAVILRGVTFELRLQSGSTIRIGSDQSGRANTAGIAERVSAFLDVPLFIEFGSHRIVKYPYAASPDAGAIPVKCVSCGAPLPSVRPGVAQATCAYCGMTMLIEWGQKDVSLHIAGQ